MAQPIFSKPARAYTNSAEYIKQLEELTKKNRGGFSAYAEPTGSNVPYYIPGRRTKAAMSAVQTSPRTPQLPESQDYAVQEELPQEEIGQEEVISVDDFINQLNESTGYQEPTAKQLEQNYQENGVSYVSGSAEGGVILNDGAYLSDEGWIQTQDGQRLEPVASQDGGGIVYNDGSIRYYDPISTGASGFVKALFGVNLDVTQTYGNQSDMYASGVHQGTDFRTKNLQNKSFSLPVKAVVMQVIRADSGSPYGNSVLLQLPTGEMVRLSHLSNLGAYQEGQTILPGQYVGTTGNTGKSTGEHLDVEYYNADGQIGDLRQFSGFTQPELLMAQQSASFEPNSRKMYEPAADIAKIRERYSQSSQQSQPQQPQFAQRSAGETLNELARQAGVNIPQVGQNIASGIQKANLTGDYGVGLAKTLQGKPEEASAQLGMTTGKVGDVLGIKEGGISEAMENPSKPGIIGSIRQGLGQGLENISDAIPRELNDKYIKPITGNALSEIFAGGKTRDTVSAYASDANSSMQPDADVDVFSTDAYKNSLLGKADQGIKNIQKGFGNLFSKAGGALFSKPAFNEMAGNRAVGNVAGGQSNVLGAVTTPQLEASKTSDTRDPFFKGQGAAQFANYMQPSDTGGALTLDMFSDQFYQNPENIKSVFGTTPHLMGGAMDKYNTYQAEQEAMRRAEEARNRPQPTLQDYLRQGKTAEQWYAENGQQSSLDQIRKTGGNIIQNAPTPNQIREQGKNNGTGSQFMTTASGKTEYAGPNQVFRVDSEGWGQKTRTNDAPVKSNSAQLTYSAQQKAQQPSLFQKAGSYISNLFKRSFN